MPVWLPHVLTLVGVVIVGLLSVWGSHVVSKRNARSADKTAEAAVQQAINTGFEKLTAGFTTQMDEAKGEMSDLRGWIRDLIQHIESLENLLRLHGIPIPARSIPHRLMAMGGQFEGPANG